MISMEFGSPITAMIIRVFRVLEKGESSVPCLYKFQFLKSRNYVYNNFDDSKMGREGRNIRAKVRNDYNGDRVF